MLKLDNNSKMIISKYLCGKNFTDFVEAFDLYDYYFTTFNYITIDNFNTQQPINEIKKTLWSFPNLNEIILNFIIDSNCINNDNFLENIKVYYDEFKQINKTIKINFISPSYKPYEELYINGMCIYDDIKPFFKNIFANFVKQNIYMFYYTFQVYKALEDAELFKEYHPMSVMSKNHIVVYFKVK